MKFLSKCFHKLLPLFIVLLVWQVVAVSILRFKGVEFPAPWQVIERLLDLFSGQQISGHSLALHVFSSLKRWAAGFSIAAVAGLFYGIAAGQFRWFEKATSGIPQMLLLVPGLAWVPIAILLLGIGESATVFMIAVSAFAPVAINVFSGIRNVDVNQIRAARMMGAGRRDLFFKVLLPASLPSVLSGLRIGLGTGWRVLVAAEMVIGTGTGLGYSVIQARWTLDYVSSFACIGVIVMIGLFFEHVLLRQLEKRTVELWSAPLEQG